MTVSADFYRLEYERLTQHADQQRRVIVRLSKRVEAAEHSQRSLAAENERLRNENARLEAAARSIGQ